MRVLLLLPSLSFPFFPPQFFKKLDYAPRSGLYDAVNCMARASDLHKNFDELINKLNGYDVVYVGRDKLSQVSLCCTLLVTVVY